MAGPRQAPFTNVEPATEANPRRRGLDSREVDRSAEQLLTHICTDLNPALPLSDPALPASDGVDRIFLNDDHLRPKGCVLPPTLADSRAMVTAISTILEAHTGPIPHVRLTNSHMSAYQAQLVRWLQLLTTKGVQELVLVNRPLPVDVPLPAALFSIASLACLYIGIWKFPDVANLKNVIMKLAGARLNLNFWKLVKPTENVKSCIKVFSYKEFRGELGEVAFLKFFFRSARVLTTASVSMANPSFTSFSMDEATHKAQQASNKMASSSCEMMLLGSTGPEGGKPWSFKTGTDYSFEDPFSVVQIRHKA